MIRPFVTRLMPAAALVAACTVQAAPAPVDYRDAASWLCRPGRADACSAPLSVATIAADGTVKVAPLASPTAPKIDCFYVYPTVSTEPTPNSDIGAGTAERSVARIQFAPFRTVCRTFAPLYRQVTLTGLRSALTGGPRADLLMPYEDVRAAWREYMARDNGGRGVILIGHSQGTKIVKALIQYEIEGQPVAAQLIAAYIPGTNIDVPEGKDIGGDFKATPLCRTVAQFGCVVSYVSFRDDAPPPGRSRFGRSNSSGMTVACVNPAALGGGRGALSPILPNGGGVVADSSAQPGWVRSKTITADFVALPGLLSSECQADNGAAYLAVRTDGDPTGPRTDRIGGDVMVDGRILADWGLHLIDINEAMGNLTALATTQSAAWLARR